MELTELFDIIDNAFRRRRFLQQAPISPEVWENFVDASTPLYAERRRDLLLSVAPGSEAGRVATALKVGLEALGHDPARSEIAANADSVVARLSLDELVCVATPLTTWWRELPAALKAITRVRQAANDPELSLDTAQKVEFYSFAATAGLVNLVLRGSGGQVTADVMDLRTDYAERNVPRIATTPILQILKSFDELWLWGRQRPAKGVGGAYLPQPSQQTKLPKDAQTASYADKSIANLSSIVCHVTSGTGSKQRSMLFTGDARGDYVLDGLEKAGLLTDGAMEVNLLKLQHHGSDRNTVKDFFKRVTARHYVASANGKYKNPDESTLRWLIDARGTDPYTIHLSNDLPWMKAFSRSNRRAGSSTCGTVGRSKTRIRSLEWSSTEHHSTDAIVRDHATARCCDACLGAVSEAVLPNLRHEQPIVGGLPRTLPLSQGVPTALLPSIASPCFSFRPSHRL